MPRNEGGSEDATLGGGAPAACALCGGDRLEPRGRIPAYVSGGEARVWECRACRSQSARGAPAIPGLYDAIYRTRERLPGYHRYARYATLVRRGRRPLLALARCEDMYWAVREVVRTHPRRRQLQVVEVGSGLGYLTAALRAEGIASHGVDVSAVAVAEATRVFGPWYAVTDLSRPASQLPVAPDLIVALEIVEHVEDPVAFLTRLAGWLAPQGQLVLSTPNPSVWPGRAVWQTDPPPVHAHWISEAGLASAARRAGCDLHQVDFSRYTRWSRRTAPEDRPTAVRPPLLGEDLRPVAPTAEWRDRLLSSPAAPWALSALRHLSGAVPAARGSSESLAATLTLARPHGAGVPAAILESSQRPGTGR